VDLHLLALSVDALVHRSPDGRDPMARLYGVVVDGDPTRPGIRLLEKGDAKRILRRVRPPRGLDALALAVGGWRAPLGPDGRREVRPSRHPERRRMHAVSIVAGAGELTTVLRSAGKPEAIEVFPGGVGVVPDLLRHCWWRARAREAGHPDADGVPWALGTAGDPRAPGA
jgi:hypothetical protein